MKTYSELITIPTIEGRFEYLCLPGLVGRDTFGGYRYLNQSFYTSREWQQFRNQIIVRDNGCDMAYPGEEIGGMIIIHHLNPITPDSIIHSDPMIFDPENVVCVSELTHKLIHYGNKEDYMKATQFIPRSPNDTCPWRRQGGL